MSPGEELPQRESLFVHLDKVTKYLLNLDHPEGGPKARYFLNCGFDIDLPQVMIDALMAHGRTQPVVEIKETKYGKKFVLECAVETPDSRNPCIISVWSIEGSEAPRFITAYPND